MLFGKLSKTARKAALRQARSAVRTGGEPPGEKPQQPAVFGNIEWVPVDSSNVAAGAYQPDFRRLFIRFKSGAMYRYENVPPAIWAEFLAAPSKGTFVWRVIRAGGTDSRYGYSRVA